jgi:nucleotide-binding universal stress UspA family protein
MFHRMLLAIDRGDAGRAGTSTAIALAAAHGGSVHVLHVNAFLVGGRGHTVECRDDGAAVVTEAVAELAAAGIRASGGVCLATCFEVATAITETARVREVDAIVLGSQRRRRPRLLGSSIREQVIRRSALPVLTAPAALPRLSDRRLRRLDDAAAAGLPPSALLRRP